MFFPADCISDTEPALLQSTSEENVFESCGRVRFGALALHSIRRVYHNSAACLQANWLRRLCIQNLKKKLEPLSDFDHLI